MQRNDKIVAKISVVVPIYKVEPYIHQCIDSIIGQTIQDLELILVVGFNSDKCEEICDQYAKRDSRIKVIKSEPKGLSDARNQGIEIATGDYIGFVDGDDYIAKDMYQNLLDAMLQYESEIAICAYSLVNEDDGKIITPPVFAENRIMSNVEAMDALFTAKPYGGVMAWNKLYKIGLFKDTGIRYPIGCLHEDNLTTYKLYYEAKNIVFINKCGYYYIQRSNSLMGLEFSLKELAALRAAEESLQFVKGKKLPLQEQVQCNYILTNFTLLNTAIMKKYNDKILLTQLKDNILSSSPMKNKCLMKRYKIWTFFLGRGMWVYRHFINQYSYMKNKYLSHNSRNE